MNLVTQPLQPADQIVFKSFRLQALEVIRPQFPVMRIVGQDVVNRDQEFMRYGDDRTFMPSSRFEAIILLAEITTFSARGGDGCLDQRRAEVGVAGSDLATTAFPGALVLAGAEAGPGGQLTDGRPLAHLGADL